ncbi:response regulator receiver protein [Aminobacter sp. NyZ550]|uniref:phosphorylase family protein n=1 Tax=Aminobacter sp. NyZ550 TaxID=2979870 RepID=UPI0021D56DF3|nr:response regulator receiver protein [Aminobacter sp. NyZ550]WAX94913.1 response regulator receiver protein [Aminobacter sp. NyZ550]
MKIAVFEDNTAKFDQIVAVLRSKGVKDTGVVRIEYLSQFPKIDALHIDLCIIDIKMPLVSNGPSASTGIEVIEMLANSGHSKTLAMAITAFSDDAECVRDRYWSRGCLIFDFYKPEQWSDALDVYLNQARDKGRYDFLIVTAIQPERDAFLACGLSNLESVDRHGIDHWDVTIGGASGTIVLLPKMGLVNASVVTSRLLEQYSPKAIAMSGICAGIGDSTKLGQLLIPDTCFEYQSGKWLNEAFQAEPYQVNMKPSTRTLIAKLIEDSALTNKLELGFNGKKRPSDITSPKLATFTSGSAVIASTKRINSVKRQHRKVSGLDMEVYGFMRSVELSGQDIHTFSAKAVVDRADVSKGDELHEYGCHIAARFTVEVISKLLLLPH